jgi:hypothetical protein
MKVLQSMVFLAAKCSSVAFGQIAGVAPIVGRRMKDKQIATRKFLIKIQGIFDSMESYHYASLSSRYGSGILRKDIDRYTDAIAEATGAVPDPVIAYVEDVYQLLRRKLGSTDSHDWSRSLLKELTIRQFAAPTDLTVSCK